MISHSVLGVFKNDDFLQFNFSFELTWPFRTRDFVNVSGRSHEQQESIRPFLAFYEIHF